MAHKKQGGKTVQHKRPEGKRLGVKVADGQGVKPGMVLVRQRGTKLRAGDGVRVGRDHTLYAIAEGKVKFIEKLGRKKVAITTK
jgi:large subunit ribosomal protein L27